MNILDAMSPVERERYDEWRKKRESKRSKHYGHSFKYVVTPCGIGQGLSLLCSCGIETNITDYGCW